MDVTAVVTSINAIGTPMALIGAAFLVIATVAVGWKWLKGMIFG